ncbi:MAG: F0F1 ATP synthase subunit epsilon [Thermodesulfovibrionales bacterium]
MEHKIRLEVVTPYGVVMSEDVDEITATGSEGEFGVLAGHANLITTLKIGSMQVRSGSKTEYLFVNTGYAEVSPDKVIVLADSAEKVEDIDIERAMEAKKRAEERLRQQENIDFARANAALQRATTRIALISRK